MFYFWLFPSQKRTLKSNQITFIVTINFGTVVYLHILSVICIYCAGNFEAFKVSWPTLYDTFIWKCIQTDKNAVTFQPLVCSSKSFWIIHMSIKETIVRFWVFINEAPAGVIWKQVQHPQMHVFLFYPDLFLFLLDVLFWYRPWINAWMYLHSPIAYRKLNSKFFLHLNT